ncbi:MAG: hypothetical protein HP058_03705, partial [Massilimaliae sp.]|nr:hypothetical protein [Massiliimalia sp.]
GGSKAQLVWNNGIMRFNRQYSRAQVWLDNEVLKDSIPYVPMETGALYKSGKLGTVFGEGVVQWIAPYARYQYYGKVMSGPLHGPKYATDKDLHYSTEAHSQAQSFWFETTKAQNKRKWINGARRLAGGG